MTFPNKNIIRTQSDNAWAVIMSAFEEETKIAVQAVLDAAHFYMMHENKVRIKPSELGSYDLVSSNDETAERMIIDAIRKAFPEDSFVCEESGKSIRNDRKWIVDPIDGTINYVHGLPIFGTQVALVEGEEPLVSVMYLPTNGELYVAEKGKGATRNGELLNMRHIAPMKHSLLSIGDYSKGRKDFRENQSRLMDALRDHVGRIKMVGSSCFDFTMFSSGRTEYHTRFVRNPWDFVPGFLMARESGAVYDEDLFKKRELYMAACSEENLQEIMNVINTVDWYQE